MASYRISSRMQEKNQYINNVIDDTSRRHAEVTEHFVAAGSTPSLLPRRSPLPLPLRLRTAESPPGHLCSSLRSSLVP